VEVEAPKPIFDLENPVYLAEKKVYYVFLFLKVSQCKLKQKETILKLGNALKSKSKFTKSKIGLGKRNMDFLYDFVSLKIKI
jgi:hypothetical protein